MTLMNIARKVVRTAFHFVVIVLWITALLGVLEIGALFAQMHMERSNPLVAAYRAGNPIPASKAEVQAETGPPFIPDTVGGWDMRPTPFAEDPSMEQVFQWGAPRGDMDAEERMSRRQAFGGLSDPARETYARLGKEMVIVFGPDRNILKVYGSDKFFFEGINRLLLRAVLFNKGIVPEVYAAVDKTLETASRQSFTLYWPHRENAEAVLSAVSVPSSGGRTGEHAYVFVNLNPDEILPGTAGGVPEDSRWKSPHFRFKANYSGDAHPGFKTNSLGFRDAERAVPKPANVFRVLCLGGSTTQEGDTNETTYPALLESRLRKAFPDRDIEVVDAGIPGISTPTHLLRFADYAALEPDLVIMHFGVNDALLKYNTWLVNAPASRLRCVRVFCPSMLAPSDDAFARFHNEYMIRNMVLMTVMFQRLGAAVAFASIARPEPNTITVPERQYYDYQGQYTWEFPAFSLGTYVRYIDASNARVKSLAQSLGAAYIPVAENLHGGTNVFTDFCHMTPAGIDTKAEIMFRAVYLLVQRRFSAIPEMESNTEAVTVGIPEAGQNSTEGP